MSFGANTTFYFKAPGRLSNQLLYKDTAKGGRLSPSILKTYNLNNMGTVYSDEFLSLSWDPLIKQFTFINKNKPTVLSSKVELQNPSSPQTLANIIHTANEAYHLFGTNNNTALNNDFTFMTGPAEWNEGTISIRSVDLNSRLFPFYQIHISTVGIKAFVKIDKSVFF